MAAALDRTEPIDPRALKPLSLEDESIWTKALPRLADALGAGASRPSSSCWTAQMRSRSDSVSALTALLEHVPAGSMIALAGRVIAQPPGRRAQSARALARDRRPTSSR